MAEIRIDKNDLASHVAMLQTVLIAALAQTAASTMDPEKCIDDLEGWVLGTLEGPNVVISPNAVDAARGIFEQARLSISG